MYIHVQHKNEHESCRSDCVCFFLFLLQHELGNTEKPEEIFDVIEHFCLGRRRLHLFGTDATIRPGNLTVMLTLHVVSLYSNNY